jgi:hypothetical protein
LFKLASPLWLRIWFIPDGTVFQQLAPKQTLTISTLRDDGGQCGQRDLRQNHAHCAA